VHPRFIACGLRSPALSFVSSYRIFFVTMALAPHERVSFSLLLSCDSGGFLVTTYIFCSRTSPIPGACTVDTGSLVARKVLQVFCFRPPLSQCTQTCPSKFCGRPPGQLVIMLSTSRSRSRRRRCSGLRHRPDTPACNSPRAAVAPALPFVPVFNGSEVVRYPISASESEFALFFVIFSFF